VLEALQDEAVDAVVLVEPPQPNRGCFAEGVLDVQVEGEQLDVLVVVEVDRNRWGATGRSVEIRLAVGAGPAQVALPAPLRHRTEVASTPGVVLLGREQAPVVDRSGRGCRPRLTSPLEAVAVGEVSEQREGA